MRRSERSARLPRPRLPAGVLALVRTASRPGRLLWGAVWRAAFFNRRCYASLRGRRHVVALGDSHLAVMWTAQRRLVDVASFDSLPIVGATALGLVNPNSQTDALGTFSARLRSAKRWQTLLCLLGEVDCGFVIWHRAEHRGVAVEDQMQASLGNYLTFLERAAERVAEVWVMSVALPTIADDAEYGEVAQARAEISADLSQRTALTIDYNTRLACECAARGFWFIDVTTAQLDPQTGVVRSVLRNDNPLDHHLAAAAFAPIVAGEIRRQCDSPR